MEIENLLFISQRKIVIELVECKEVLSSLRARAPIVKKSTFEISIDFFAKESIIIIVKRVRDAEDKSYG